MDLGIEQTDEKKDPETTRVLKRAQHYALELSREIETLLQYSVSERTDMEVQLSAIDIAELIESRIDSASLQMKNSNNAVHYKHTGPRYSQHRPLLLRHVIDNLLQNAIQHCSDGEISVTSSIDSYLTIEVLDTGSGIRAEDIDRVFDPMFRGDSGTGGQQSGSGVGLSICRHWVEDRLGGEISVVSEWGEFSRFTVRFPVIQ